MTIWVDADACPVVVREILFRAARRTGEPLVLVANQSIATPSVPNISMMQVPQGYDAADDEIARRVVAGDLVITQDIPLAKEVIDKDALALSPRGELFTRANIVARLNMRDFLETMRSSGVHTGGPSALSQSDKQAFAKQLDKWLAKR
ncbi:YaiI/YqxD family protein [Teredinibacter turnerae]|uniref:YaiI/YqxD family protein n=1 Tax=Teredinibacter turnerae TaxID=2426 RepID=UPI0003785E43|nr:YaiI/YqxD family protein [Teredinibacter turnerae]